MAKVFISTHDPIILTVMDEKETDDTFGDEFIDDYGVEIPEELLQQYKKCDEEFNRIQNELKKYYA